jgi:hypothetical protein
MESQFCMFRTKMIIFACVAEGDDLGRKILVVE